MPFLYAFGVFFRAVLGVGTIVFARMTADLFGSHNHSRVTGLAYVGGAIGLARGPPFAGAVFDITGNRLGSSGVAAVVFVLSLV
jgi:hypothetical protein